MRLEHIPLILGAIVALIGLAFIADGVMADTARPTTERRRRMRAERSRAGEAIVGIGTLCMAAALIGRDTWRYGTVAVLAGAVLVLIGIVLNRSFLKEALFFRGPARRADPLSLDSPHARHPAVPVNGGRSAAAARPDANRATQGRADLERPASRPEGTAAPAARPDVVPPSPRPGAVPPAARPDAPPPPSTVERRKNPRGRK